MKGLSIVCGDAKPGQKVRLFKSQVHERNGQRCIPTARGASDHLSECSSIHAHLFRLSLLVEHKVGADRHPQSSSGEFQIKGSIHAGTPFLRPAVQAAQAAAKRLFTRVTAPLALSLYPSAPISLA